MVADAIEATDQLDEIASPLASSEAVPEISSTIDDEGQGIVTFVDRTRPNEPIAATKEPVDEASIFEETLDADALFEASEVELRTHQRRDRFRLDMGFPAGTLLPKVSK